MAKVSILGQAAPNGKMLIRGVFTTKKNLWETVDKIEKLKSLTISDDMGGRTAEADYAILCSKLRETGRAVLQKNGKTLFLILEANLNELRDWDIDKEGKPRCNPL